jgi:ABC-2 type transport system ATP-binding protein
MPENIIVAERLGREFTMRRQAVPGWRGWLAKSVRHTVEAVAELSFTIEAGAKVAFIGPNGAGKSTTLRMLCGLLRPTSGTAHVCGLVPWVETRRLARSIGLVFGQRSHLWPSLPVRDSYDLLAKIYDLKPEDYRAQRTRLAAVFGLDELLAQPARTLSLGQRMRCDLGAALLHQPPVLFLDEPTIGLDVVAKALLRDHLNLLAHEFNTTILLTSHDTDDIERICDRVMLIDRGRKLLDTSLGELQRDYNRFKTLRLATAGEAPAYARGGVTVMEQGLHRLVLTVDTSAVALEQVIADCLGRFSVQDIAIEGVPLEEIVKNIYATRLEPQ